MRKPAFCICENKDADQLRGNREADQRLCFRYRVFVSDLVGNPEDRFSHNEAHIDSATEASFFEILKVKYAFGHQSYICTYYIQ